MKEHRVVELVQRRQEFANVVGAALADADQIDAGGKDLALPGQHDGFRRAVAQFGKARRQRLAEFDVERIGLAVPQGDDGNAVIDRDVDHAACPTASGTRASARCDSRSAWTMAMLNTTIAIT